MELRKDYMLDRWVIINPKRGLRPHQFTHKKNPAKIKACFFCKGNEQLTPMEIGRVGTEKHWEIMWFMNKFPAVQSDGNYLMKHSELFTHSDSYGWHEIIVETDEHNKQLFDLSKPHVLNLLKVYQDRIKYIREKEGIKYVALFKNHGPDAGTSIEHSHSQLIGYNMVPVIINEKIKKSLKVGCKYCDIWKEEIKSERRRYLHLLISVFIYSLSSDNFSIEE